MGKSNMINRLGHLAQEDYRIAVYCQEQGCGHSGELDLPSLAQRFHPDARCLHVDLHPWLTCTACGKRNASVRLHPPTGTTAEKKAKSWRYKEGE